MSLLVQCAWMWEHCTISAIEGEFRLSDICKGLYSRKRGDAKTGYASIDMGMCQYWEHFADGIDGLKYFDRQTGEVTLEFGDFRCSYWLTDVFKITSGFCRATGCSSLANKYVFGYKDGERWTRLPSATKPVKKAKKKKEARVVVRQIAQPKQTKVAATPLSIADRLRAALRARLAA